MSQDTNPLAIKTFTLEEAVKEILSILNIPDKFTEKDLLRYGADGKLEICTRLTSDSHKNYKIPSIFSVPIIEIKYVDKKFIHEKYNLPQNLWMSSETYEEKLFHPDIIRINNPPFNAVWEFRWLHRDFRYLNYQTHIFNFLIRMNKSYLGYLSHSDIENPEPLEFREFYLCKEHSLWVSNNDLTKSEELLKELSIQDIPDKNIPSKYKNGKFIKGLSICCALPITVEQPIKIKNPELLITKKTLDDFIPFLRQKYTIQVKPVNRTSAQQDNILLLLDFLARRLQENSKNTKDRIFFDEKINQWVVEKELKNKKPIIFFDEKKKQWLIENRRNPSVKTMVRDLIEKGQTNVFGQKIEWKNITDFTYNSFENNWESLTSDRKIVYIKLKKLPSRKNSFIFEIIPKRNRKKSA